MKRQTTGQKELDATTESITSLAVEMFPDGTGMCDESGINCLSFR